MQFGWFVYFQDRGNSVTQMYDDHLAEIELADALGYNEVWLAEHHFSGYGLVPSPNVMLAHLAARTQHLRLGAMVYALPFYHPLRLAEELAMLDHLTHGRLNVGVGSGVQREYGPYNLDVAEARPRYYEAIEVLHKAFTHERFTHEGQYYRIVDGSLAPRPVQQPYPPLWVAASSAASVEWCAQRGLPVAQNWTRLAEAAQAAASYRAVAAQAAERWGTPAMRQFRVCYVADTTERAFAEAEPNLYRFFQLFSRSEDPHYTTPSPEGWHHQTGIALRRLGPQTFADLDADDLIIVGDPARVREKLLRLRAETGMDGFVGIFAFGRLSHEQVSHSLRLFAEEVMPALRTAPLAASA